MSFDFTEAEGLIKDIGADCPKTLEALTDGLDAIKAVSCAADGVGKTDAFDDAAVIIAQALIDCPSHADDLKRLSELIEAGKAVKCSGG